MNDKDSRDSIFRRYYSDEQFVDRFVTAPQEAVDVIIPLMHTNELWENNLLSFYREIPINRLLIGDGGCIDNSLDVTKKFPRVKILDHRNFVSLGYSIRKLIEEVETEWFIYLHSDVFLPDGWFEAMKKHQGEYDWFGCPMRHTVMVEYQIPETFRPYAGSQMGRRVAFQRGLERIDDDYVYRQEDFVFADIVEKAGFSNGRVEDTFHYHQTMYRPSRWYDLKIRKVKLETEIKREEQVRSAMMQVKGIIKYLEPSPIMYMWMHGYVLRLLDLNEMNWKEFRKWIIDTNPRWLPYFRFWGIEQWLIKRTPRLYNILKALFPSLLGKRKRELLNG